MKFYNNRVGLLQFLGIPAINIVGGGWYFLTRDSLDELIYNLGSSYYLDKSMGYTKESDLPMTIERGLALKHSWSKMVLPYNMEEIKQIILERNIDETLPPEYGCAYSDTNMGEGVKYFHFVLPQRRGQTAFVGRTNDFTTLEGAVNILEGREYVRNSSSRLRMRKEVAVLLLQLAIRSGLPTIKEPFRLFDS